MLIVGTGMAMTASDGLPTTVTELHMTILDAEAGALPQTKVRISIRKTLFSLHNQFQAENADVPSLPMTVTGTDTIRVHVTMTITV